MTPSGSIDAASAGAAVLLPGFVGTELPEWLAARLRAGLGGVCLFAENISSPQQLRQLTAAARGLALTGAVLVYEHVIVRADDLSRVNRAFFTANGVIGIGLFAFALADLIVHGLAA